MLAGCCAPRAHGLAELRQVEGVLVEAQTCVHGGGLYCRAQLLEADASLCVVEELVSASRSPFHVKEHCASLANALAPPNAFVMSRCGRPILWPEEGRDGSGLRS